MRRLNGVPFLHSPLSLLPEERTTTRAEVCERTRKGERRMLQRGKDVETNHGLPEPRSDPSATLKTGSGPVNCLSLRELARSFPTKTCASVCILDVTQVFLLAHAEKARRFSSPCGACALRGSPTTGCIACTVNNSLCKIHS